MLGSASTKTLLLSLQALFNECRASKGEEDTGLHDLTIQSIHDYVAEHDSAETVKQARPIGSELFRIYAVFIEPEPVLPLEYLFLEILQLLCPVLSSADTEKWLKTFLNSAIDSAGLDYCFVLKCREFIIAILLPIPSPDENLTRQRAHVARVCCEKLLQILLATNDALPEIIGISSETSSTEKHLERLRYIRANVSGLIRSYAISQPHDFYVVINKHFQTPSCRPKILFLVSTLISSTAAGPHIVASGFWESVLKCALQDIDTAVVRSVVNYICMATPLVASELGVYISDMLLTFLRSSIWPTIDHDALFEAQTSSRVASNKWEVATPFHGGILKSDSPQNHNAAFVLLLNYLGAILYGLFPFSFCEFRKNPAAFLDAHSPQVIPLEEGLRFLQVTKTKIDSEVHVVFKSLLCSLVPHPQLLSGETRDIAAELEDPLSWIEREHGSRDSDTIALALIDLLGERVSGPYDLRALKMNSGKVPLVPLTHNSLDMRDEMPVHDNDVTEELLSEHANLYGLKHDARENEGASSEPIIRLESEKPQLEYIQVRDEQGDFGSGTLQFYQRELLLQKNELEFVTYVSCLYKARIKKAANQRQPTVLATPKLEDCSTQVVKNLEDKIRDQQLISEKEIEELGSALNLLRLDFDREHSLLVDLQEQLQNDKHSLEIILDSVIPEKDSEIARLKNELASNITSCDTQDTTEMQIPQQKGSESHETDAAFYRLDEKYESLRCEHSKLAVYTAQLESQLEELRASKLEIEDDQKPLQSVLAEIVEGYQKQITDIKGQVAQFERVVEKQNLQIVQLSSMQPIPIPQNANSIRNDRFERSSTRSGSDKGIETEWDDKSEPIVGAPPRRGSKFSATVMSGGFRPPTSERTSSHSSTASPPSVNPRQHTQPVILMGRGGYQKRIKKMM